MTQWGDRRRAEAIRRTRSFVVLSSFSSVTDAQGHFVLTLLPAAAYWIEAQRDNFLNDSGAPLTLAPGEEKKDLVLRITPYGAIAGHVRTEEGDPMSNLRVTAMVYEYRTGGRQLVSRSSITTNDLGEYRLFGLIAGKYFLRTDQRTTPGAGGIYPATYYPGATDAPGAAPLELGAGQELRDRDLVLYRTHAWTIRGKVAMPAGASRIVVSLNENGMTSTGVDERTGAFELRGVAPGAYILTAYGGAGEKTYIARQPIQVATADIDGIELHLAPYVDLKGVLRIQGATRIKPSQLRIGWQGSTADVNNDGTFTFRDLRPDIDRPVVSGAEDLFVKSIRCGPADVTESGVDLTGARLRSCDQPQRQWRTNRRLCGRRPGPTLQGRNCDVGSPGHATHRSFQANHLRCRRPFQILGYRPRELPAVRLGSRGL